MEVPIGSIVPFAGPVAKIPNNYKLCDGLSLDRTTAFNKPLFDIIGVCWGGDGANMFNLPDLRGLFLRGVNNGSGRDPEAGIRVPIKPGGHAGDEVGTLQLGAFSQHRHPAQVEANSGGHGHSIQISRNNIAGTNRTRDADGGHDKWNCDPDLGSLSASTTSDGAHNHGVTVSDTGGSETRPINAAVHWIIRCA
jgi:microcystin-dependent protein